MQVHVGIGKGMQAWSGVASGSVTLEAPADRALRTCADLPATHQARVRRQHGQEDLSLSCVHAEQ